MSVKETGDTDVTPASCLIVKIVLLRCDFLKFIKRHLFVVDSHFLLYSVEKLYVTYFLHYARAIVLVGKDTFA